MVAPTVPSEHNVIHYKNAPANSFYCFTSIDYRSFLGGDITAIATCVLVSLEIYYAVSVHNGLLFTKSRTLCRRQAIARPPIFCAVGNDPSDILA